jgi:hypothetical protein
MRWFNDGEKYETFCAVGLEQGGEFTICGAAIPDSDVGHEEFDSVGEEYEGLLKDVTCGRCLQIIRFIKSLK